MVDALISVAIQTIRDLLIDEAKFLYRVSNQVQDQVKEDLRRMHSLLMDADKWSDRQSNRLHSWMMELLELAFEAETVLEKYAVEVTSRKEGRTLTEKLKRFACILIECCSLHQVGKEAEGIRSRLDKLTNELNSMSGGGSSSSDADQQQLLRLRYHHEVVQHFVGMEKDIDYLVSMMKEKDDKKCNSPVVSICGMGGLGKTTLARKIYHHQELQGCFDARAWVCVTQQFQADTILREILKQVGQEINRTDLRQLVPHLHDVLLHKKCLIVIDDIWEANHWDILKPAFPATTNCRVLLTTRNEHIAAQDCTVYKLGLLTEDQGWELLHKTAIPDGAGFMEFEPIGRQMVQKCGRLPLAIFVIGGILRQNQKMVEWEKVSGNIDSYLKRGEGYEINNGVIQVLDLSYYVLPYYLKPCFLYLACFPEDEEIKTEQLYLLWIAEGLISSQDKGRNETLRDVAERYLSELACRCMVQVQKDEDKVGLEKFTSCRLHDLMRDLSLSKAEEINFLKRLSSPKQLFDELSSSVVTPSRRLVVCFEFEGGRLPRMLDKLIHMRYLSLRWSDVEELPGSICDMPYLETLDLRVIYSIELPNVIYKMKKLRHLFLSNFSVIGGDKLILDGLEELETLEYIRSDIVCNADIPKLTNLRKLVVEVRDMDCASILAPYMCSNKIQLREAHLSIGFCDFSSEEGEVIFRNILMSPSLVFLTINCCEFRCAFPSYQQGMCRNLVKLEIFVYMIEGDLMGILGKYPMLRNLRISFAKLQPNMICFANSFPQLKSLQLVCISNLRKWEVEERAMPKLTRLEINDCRNLEGLPLISTLRELVSREMPKEFNDKLRVVNDQPGEDYHKVSHIPSLKLFDIENF